MELEKYITKFNEIKPITKEQQNMLLDEFDFFCINYNLWHTQTVAVEESNPNKTFDYDDRLINFLNQQEENLINLTTLKDYTIKGIIYFDFKKFWKENYFKMSSKKINEEIKLLVKEFCK